MIERKRERQEERKTGRKKERKGKGRFKHPRQGVMENKGEKEIRKRDCV